ncbi:dihydropteroate synthase [Rhodobacteraceae bacterium 63075]|nr:dihydropteroate synthase [Rhodobacteraceae bacterium 63075]
MTRSYYRPQAQLGKARPPEAVALAGGPCWFTHAERMTRDGRGEYLPAAQLPEDALQRLCAPRAPIAGLEMSEPNVMGILNVTPDSFSDGGRINGAAAALSHARSMRDAGADIIDVGGESTRPGAVEVPFEAEIARTAPVIKALSESMDAPISIDTRKRAVAEEAARNGAGLVNDVSGFTFDPDLGDFCAQQKLPVCIMHAQGDPQTMQDNPHYENVLLDVYDFLEGRISALEAQGVARDRMIVDPGIGFGKRIEHNLALLNGLSLFHGLGCPILLGVSRKGFIRVLGDAEDPQKRAPGSIAAGLAGLAQGVQILRVHDVAETRQAVKLWQAATGG